MTAKTFPLTPPELLVRTIAAEERLRFLVEVSMALATSLAYERTLAQVAHLPLPFLADCCTVELLDPQGALEIAAVADVVPERGEMLRELRRQYPLHLAWRIGFDRLLHTGQTALVRSVEEDFLMPPEASPQERARARALTITSIIVVPLVARGQTLGILKFCRMAPSPPYHQEDVALAEAVTYGAALALDNARLYEAEQQGRRQVQHAAERTRRLHTVTAALSDVLQPNSMMRLIIEQSMDALGATRGSVVLRVGEDMVETACTVGFPEDLVTPWARFPLAAQVPITDTIRTGQLIWFDSMPAAFELYPQLTPSYLGPNRSIASIPLTVEGRTIGAIGLSFEGRRALDEDDQAFALALAQQCAQALERSRLYEAERVARDAAEAERARLRDMVMQAPTLMALFEGPEHRLVLANPPLLALMGIGEEHVGLLTSELPLELVAQGAISFVQQVYQSGTPVLRQEQPVWLAGQRGTPQEHVLTFAALPLRDRTGAVDGVLIHAVEVTEQVQARRALESTTEQIRRLNATLEQRVQRRTAQLAASNKELEAFSYSVSHDLRAPLRSISGFSQAILEDYGNRLDEEGQDYLNRIIKASHRMGYLIDALLDLSRVTRAEMVRRRVNLSELAREVAASLQAGDPERTATFHIQETPPANGDVRLLRLVLDNLLCNAWKFSAPVPVAHIEFGSVAEGTVYFVRDNGVGFDMAYSQRLFLPFQRLHLASEFEGTGIGLATVQRIVQRHGGRAWAEGETGGGATFYFTLK